MSSTLGRTSTNLLLAACVLGLTACAPSAPPPAVPPRTDPAATPNVVVLVVDDLGFADVGFHGGAVRTPALDRLAREGVELTRFYAYPVCAPTRAALMTGRSMQSMDETRNLLQEDGGLALAEHLMPQSFRDAGYQTWLVGKWHLGGRQNSAHLPQRRGFDHFYGFLGGTIDAYEHVDQRTGAVDWQRNGVTVRERGYCTDLLADEAVGLIERRDERRPFLLVLAFHAVHRPYQAPPGTHADQASPRATYLAMLERLDDAVARVLATLDGEAIGEETIVLLLGDNGGQPPPRGAASNAPWRGGKDTVLEGGIHVPAVLRWRGVLAGGGRSAQLMSVADVFPTLAGAAGIRPRSTRPLDGVDLWPSVARGEVTARPSLVLCHEGCAVIDGWWKLLRLPTGDLELYDLQSDPREERNVADAHPDVVDRLASLP